MSRAGRPGCRGNRDLDHLDMDHSQDRQRRLQELIDAARAGSDDAAHPDFALLAERARLDPTVRGLWQRSQRFDLAVSEALHDLPVPSGSVERLLAVLEAAAVGATPAVAKVPAFVAVPEEASADETPAKAEDPAPRAVKRNSWPGQALLVAASAAVALAAYLALRPAAVELGPLEILSADWLLTVNLAAVEQNPMDKTPPRRYPTSTALHVQPIAWRSISGLWERTDGVAYQLRTPAARATLYVIDDDAGHQAPQFGALPTAPPSTAPVTTGGRAMSVWRDGKLVYLLVVEGGDAEYQAFVTPRGQLARGHGSRGRFDRVLSRPAGAVTAPAESS